MEKILLKIFKNNTIKVKVKIEKVIDHYIPGGLNS